MDLQIAVFINKLLAETFLDSVTILVSSKFFLAILWTTLLGLTFILSKKYRYTILLAAVISIIIHFLITDWFFKEFLGYFFELRVRPYLAYPDLITALGSKSTDASFPSGHMSSMAALLTVFIYFFRKMNHAVPTPAVGQGVLGMTWTIWLLAILFAIAMAFSRIHNGMHYPTDVLAGAILGVIYGLIGVYTTKKLITSVGK
jgi:undecaprenyl-diphosphatase